MVLDPGNVIEEIVAQLAASALAAAFLFASGFIALLLLGRDRSEELADATMFGILVRLTRRRPSSGPAEQVVAVSIAGAQVFAPAVDEAPGRRFRIPYLVRVWVLLIGLALLPTVARLQAQIFVPEAKPSGGRYPTFYVVAATEAQTVGGKPHRELSGPPLSRRQAVYVLGRSGDGEVCEISLGKSEGPRRRDETRLFVACGCLAPDQPKLLVAADPTASGLKLTGGYLTRPERGASPVRGFGDARPVGYFDIAGERWWEFAKACKTGYVRAVRPPTPAQVATLRGSMSFSGGALYTIAGRRVVLLGVDAVHDRRIASDVQAYLADCGHAICERAEGGQYDCFVGQAWINETIQRRFAGPAARARYGDSHGGDE